MELCNTVSHLESVNTFVLGSSDHELSSFLCHKNNLCSQCVSGCLGRCQADALHPCESEALVLALEAGVIQAQPIRGQYSGHVIRIDQSEARSYPSSAGRWLSVLLGQDLYKHFS